MKFIAILVTFVVAFVGSSCAASTEQQHGRKLGKKSAKSAKVENPMNYFSLLSAAQRNLALCPISSTSAAPAPTAIGNAIVTYDSTLLTGQLCVRLTYAGLVDLPTVVSINGPASTTSASGAVVYTFLSTSFTSASDGSAVQCFDATAAQKLLFDSGDFYFNIITDANPSTPGSPTCPSGELRGQIVPTP
jgi:hypothetical protein